VRVENGDVDAVEYTPRIEANSTAHSPFGSQRALALALHLWSESGVQASGSFHLLSLQEVLRSGNRVSEGITLLGSWVNKGEK
jgi:hypothetical protein